MKPVTMKKFSQFPEAEGQWGADSNRSTWMVGGSVMGLNNAISPMRRGSEVIALSE